MSKMIYIKSRYSDVFYAVGHPDSNDAKKLAEYGFLITDPPYERLSGDRPCYYLDDERKVAAFLKSGEKYEMECCKTCKHYYDGSKPARACDETGNDLNKFACGFYMVME